MDNSVLLYGSIVAGALVIISVIVIIIVRKTKSKNGSTTSNSMRNMRNMRDMRDMRDISPRDINPRDRMRARHELELLRRKFDKTSHFGKGGDDPWSKYLNSLSLDERKDEANRLLEIIHRKHKTLVNSGTNSNSFVRGGGATGGTAANELLSRTGCTDSTATNYNSNAFIDDGSCTYDVSVSSGCTDSTADNYDSSATEDDGSCEYSGCTDSLALNYDDSANVNSNYCLYGYDTTMENVKALLQDLYLEVNNDNNNEPDTIQIVNYTAYFDTELFTVLNKIVSPLYGEITVNNDRGSFADFDTSIYNDITLRINNDDLSGPGADMGTDAQVAFFISNIAAYVGAIAWFFNTNSNIIILYFTDGDVPPTNIYPDTYVSWGNRIGYWGEP